MATTTHTQFVMVGSGQLGTQPNTTNAALPPISVTNIPTSSANGSTAPKSAAFATTSISLVGVTLCGLGAAIAALL